MIPFNKPPLHHQQQIDLLKSRGLKVSDNDYALKLLQEIAYYRLSAYFIPFESERHKFKDNIALEDIVKLYDFDHQLRLIIDSALEKIELFLRSQISNTLAIQNGIFAHENKILFKNSTDHESWMNKAHSQIENSKEVFIRHFKDKYFGFPAVPIWMAIEIISLGSLSHLYKNLKKESQKNISNQININYLVLEKWMHFFTYIRNICAHHSRLWNRTLAISPVRPNHFDARWSILRNDHLAFALVVIDTILGKMPRGESYSINFKAELKKIFLNPPKVDSFFEKTGFNNQTTFDLFINGH